MELQLSLLFPLLALCWKHFGSMRTGLSVLGATAAAWVVTDGGTWSARPQYVVLFFLGFVAASIVSHVPSAKKSHATRRLAIWYATLIGAVTLLLLLPSFQSVHTVPHLSGLLWDLLVGVFALATIVLTASPHSHMLRQVLEWKPFVHLGQISFGIYIVHDVLLRHLFVYLQPTPFVSEHPLLLLCAIGILPVLGVAYLFHRVMGMPKKHPSA